MRTLLIIAAAAFLLSGIAFCGDSTETETETEKKTDSTKAEEKVEKKMEMTEYTTTELGVKYTDLVVGEGAECKIGSNVECHYTLWFATPEGVKDSAHFQSSKDGGNTFTCTLGTGLIAGWSDGMVGMKEGGTRQMIIPPEHAYGQGGRGIPPNQTLVFEIDFIKLIK